MRSLMRWDRYCEDRRFGLRDGGRGMRSTPWGAVSGRGGGVRWSSLVSSCSALARLTGDGGEGVDGDLRFDVAGRAFMSTRSNRSLGREQVMEDTQPNEVRLSRKGSMHIPHVRPVHTPYRRPPPSCDTRPSKRIRWQPPPPPGYPSSATDRALGHQFVEVRLPWGCHKGAPGSHHARKRWIEDQKYHLSTDRHLSVISFKYLDDKNSTVLFNCRTQATQSTGHYATGYSNPQVILPPTEFVVSSTQTE